MAATQLKIPALRFVAHAQNVPETKVEGSKLVEIVKIRKKIF